MARKDRKDRGLFERIEGSGIYWISYARRPDGAEHMGMGAIRCRWSGGLRARSCQGQAAIAVLRLQMPG